jgi:glutamine amidotransferase
MIAIVDYGLGNVQAFEDIYRSLNIEVVRASSVNALLGASRLILPGVGSFDRAMQLLNRSGLRDALDELVLHRRVPVLGVCVGMQMMARRSEEGSERGLSWLDADVVRLSPASAGKPMPIPHMGWNDVRSEKDGSLLAGCLRGYFYFLHSYYIVPDSPDNLLASASYGGRFAAAVSSGSIFGTQFHPEKSHQAGVNLLRAFGCG